MNMICPNCGADVVPAAGGICPRCAHPLLGLAAAMPTPMPAPPPREGDVQLASTAGPLEIEFAGAQERQKTADLRETFDSSKYVAFITPTIVALNIIVYLAMGFSGVGWINVDASKTLAWGVDYSPLTTTGDWWRLLTSAFIHFGLLHILFNMWALSTAGVFTERLFGRRFYLLIYLFGALGSGLASSWWDKGYSAGASGAIFAVYGALLIYLLTHRGTFPTGFLTPLLTSTCVFIGYNIFYGLTQSDISNAAHIGGLASGVLMGFVVGRPLDPVRRHRQTWPRLFAGLIVGTAAIWMGIRFMPRDYEGAYDLGVEYNDGKELPQDFAKAMKYYLRAAGGGNADAMNNIGVLYLNGTGVTKDDRQAVAWYQKAADKGLPLAMRNLAGMYEDGVGVTKDYQQALAWYQKAANAGDADAMNNVGYFYEQGRGVDRDYAEAMTWYLKAANAGDGNAMNNVGYFYEQGRGVDRDYARAMTWWRKAADAGDALSMRDIGVLYEQGRGVPQDYSQAMAWYQKAASGGDVPAMYYIGELYENGQGVAKDRAQAITWYQKASAAGDADAKKRLAELGVK
jgi:TPR repeat protein/membrane associated rhomboid family serine protease